MLVKIFKKEKLVHKINRHKDIINPLDIVNQDGVRGTERGGAHN